jgi:thymidylate kinase
MAGTAPMSATGKLIVLEGIDGVGKTTLAQKLASALDGDVTYCSPKTIATTHPHLEWSMRTLASILWPTEERKEHAHRLPTGYWLSLQAAWYAVLSDAVVTPALAAGRVLLVDGWYFKFVAKLLVGGAELAPSLDAFRAARKPDAVLLLETPPSDVWARRAGFSAYEMGSIQGYEDLGRGSFVAYQTRIQEQLAALATSQGWRRVPLAGSASVADNVERLRRTVLEIS